MQMKILVSIAWPLLNVGVIGVWVPNFGQILIWYYHRWGGENAKYIPLEKKV